MNENSSNCSFNKKEDFGYENKYPMPSNEEQAKMVLNAIYEDKNNEISNSLKK